MNKVILFLLILFASTGFAQPTELTLASDVWPPFTDVEDKEAFAIDLVKEALNRVNITTKVKIQDFENVLAQINSGEFDGSAALWISEEREKTLLFSEPYLKNQLILVSKKGGDVSAESFSSLKGKRIGLVKDYSYGIDDSEEIEFINGNSDQQNLERLLSDQIDYMLVDALLIQYMLKYQVNDVSEFLEIGSKPLAIKSLHFALGKEVSNAEQIMASFNDEIKKMIADGTYNKILELNWIQADIDGDGQMEFILDGNIAGTEAPGNVYGIDPSTSTGQEDSTQRYYVNGIVYDGWKNIPEQYKLEFKDKMIMDSQAGRGIIQF